MLQIPQPSTVGTDVPRKASRVSGKSSGGSVGSEAEELDLNEVHAQLGAREDDVAEQVGAKGTIGEGRNAGAVSRAVESAP